MGSVPSPSDRVPLPARPTLPTKFQTKTRSVRLRLACIVQACSTPLPCTTTAPCSQLCDPERASSTLNNA